MSARLHQHLDRPSLELSQLGELVRALLAFVAAFWATKPQEDTAIAWEDGEETSRN